MAFLPPLSSPGPRQPYGVPAACVTRMLSEEGVLAGEYCRAELLAARSAKDEQFGLCLSGARSRCLHEVLRAAAWHRNCAGTSPAVHLVPLCPCCLKISSASHSSNSSKCQSFLELEEVVTPVGKHVKNLKLQL